MTWARYRRWRETTSEWMAEKEKESGERSGEK